MRCLFFDEEFAQSHCNGNICEFGYVITDEHFNILDKDNLVMNPSLNGDYWDPYVLEHIITYPLEYYEQSPIFPEYYTRIKELINSSDLIFGHTLSSDVERLNEECKKFNLDFLNFTFYDVKDMYGEYINAESSVGLQTIIENEHITTFGLAHNALYDAGNTMLCLKKMVDELELSIKDLIMICQNSIDKTENGVIQSQVINEMIKEEGVNLILNGENGNYLFKHHKNDKIFKKFYKNVSPTEEIDNPYLKFKNVSISLNFEECHFHEMLNLIQLLCNNGAYYEPKSSQSDIFIKYDSTWKDGTPRKCSRLEHVKQAKSSGKKIKIIEFNDILKILNTTMEELSTKEIFDRKVLFKKTRKEKVDYSKYNDVVTNTLADFINLDEF